MQIIDRNIPADEIATKYILATSDGFAVETTYINQDRKHILCVSTQVGCPIGCRFCVSGLRSQVGKYQRNLTAAEIVEECRSVAREIDLSLRKPLLFSFMGEGEPFLNFDACLGAFRALVAMEWPVPVRLAVSTSGIRPDLIRTLGAISLPVPLKLQLSLHGPTDEVRARIIPNTRPISDILEAGRSWLGRDGRSIEWNYVLCAGVNDELEHARILVALLGPGWHVKFNRLNLSSGSPFTPTSLERVGQFRAILESGGITTEYYTTDESGISSGCGQLSYRRALELGLR